MVTATAGVLDAVDQGRTIKEVGDEPTSEAATSEVATTSEGESEGSTQPGVEEVTATEEDLTVVDFSHGETDGEGRGGESIGEGSEDAGKLDSELSKII